MKSLDVNTRNSLSPDAVIRKLREGNQRYINNTITLRDTESFIVDTATGQSPMAIIHGCVDSRVIPEQIFDLGIGDVFTSRTAGNVVDVDILGSMEFACKASGSKLIVVLGHTSCGAVKGACDHVEMGNLTPLLDKIQPAVADTPETADRSSKNLEFVNRVVENHVVKSIEHIRKQSAILNEMEEKGDIRIVGAIYHIESGRVDWL